MCRVPGRLILPVFFPAFLFSAVLGSPRQARAADPMRDFVMSCSYGVLAGTLVGAAALAFTDKPGDNLDMVARGASLGLYAGILLGLYVTSAPDGLEDESGVILPPQGLLTPPSRPRPDLPRAMLVPIFGGRGVEGGRLQFSVARF